MQINSFNTHKHTSCETSGAYFLDVFVNSFKDLSFIGAGELKMKLHGQCKCIGEMPSCTPMSQNIMTTNR